MGCGVSKTIEDEKNSDSLGVFSKTKNSIVTNLEINSRTSRIVEWKNLSIDQLIYFKLLNSLSENDNLLGFILRDVDITGESDKLIELAKILMTKSNLRILEFHSLFNLGKKKGKSIAKIMEICNKVEKLVLDNLELEEQDAEFIGLILKNFTESLIYFEISLVFFENNLQSFLDGLYSNNNIRELVLNKINLTCDYFVFLLEAVSTNSCLIRLDVSNNPIREGVRGFGEFPLMNIVTLQMNNCGIDDFCMSLLLKGLENNNSIRIIELNQNEITNDAVDDIKLFFEKNSALKTMYLLNNRIGKNALRSKLSSADNIKIVAD